MMLLRLKKAAELEAAQRKAQAEELNSGKITDEELKSLAKKYIEEGKLEPGEYDNDTLRSKLADIIIAEEREKSSPEHALN